MFELVIRSFGDAGYRHVVARRSNMNALGKIEDGANINLNHDQYYTEIEKVEALEILDGPVAD